MNLSSSLFVALSLCVSPSSSLPATAPATLPADSLEDLQRDIEATLKQGALAESKAVEFATRALKLARAAKDATARAQAAGAAFSLPLGQASAELDKLRGQMWDFLSSKDADNPAVFAPLVSKYMKEVDRAAALAKKTKAPEVKAACAFVPLAPLLKARDRSEQDTKKLVEGLNAIKKEFGQVVDPSSKKPWGELCDDKLFPIEHLSIGCEVPEIEGADTAGVKFKLSDYRGKVVLLDFWGNW